MKTLRNLLLFFWLLIFSFPDAIAKDTGPYESKLEEGIEAFYQTDWEKASGIFDELQAMNGQDPRAYFFDAMIPFWEYFFGGNSSEAATDFLERSSKAIEISENRLQMSPHDTTMVLMLSGLHGYRSLVAAGEKNYQTAVSSGMTGFTYTRQLLKLDDEDPRALIGKGIFYYMMGTVPKQLRWATNLMGMKGDRQEGYQTLEQAAASESYVSNDARMILSYLYKKEGRFEEALNHIKELCRKYPQNIIFQFHYAELLNSTDRRSEARRAYQAVVELPNTQLSELKSQSRDRLRNL